MSIPTGGYDVEAIKKSALIWTIAGFLCGGTIGGILGLIGYLKADTEPETAMKFTKIAKIVTIVIAVLGILGTIVYIILMVMLFNSAPPAPSY